MAVRKSNSVRLDDESLQKLDQMATHENRTAPRQLKVVIDREWDANEWAKKIVNKTLGGNL